MLEASKFNSSENARAFDYEDLGAVHDAACHLTLIFQASKNANKFIGQYLPVRRYDYLGSSEELHHFNRCCAVDVGLRKIYFDTAEGADSFTASEVL